jgi:hypothetical protein
VRNNGLTDTVVPVWNSGNGIPDAGGLSVLSDRIDLEFVAENINGIFKTTGRP